MTELNFKGKEFVYNHHLAVPFHPLEPHPDKGIGEVALDGNLIVHGDNLKALKALMPTHAGKINCIYIDPPYNTGKEGWCYNDNVNSPMIKEWFSEQPVDSDDGLRHDKWCAMMWPRLRLLHELLAENGVIFISIDDNEQHHLRMMMDEIFGEENFVETFIWKKKGGASNTETIVGDIVENIIMFAKDISSLAVNRRVIQSANYPNRDSRGSFRFQSLTKTDEGMYRRDTMKFGIPVPGTGELAYPPQKQRWTSGKVNMMDMLQADLLHFERSDHGYTVRRKDYFNETDPQTGVYLNLFLECGSLRTAKNELTRIEFGREDFDTPKPTTLLTQLLRIATGPDSIVLDSFAGSGTTAHAVLALNKEDGGNRKFILVECEDYADSITAERVRRVIKGVPKAKDESLREGLGGSFTYCTLGRPVEMDAILRGESLPAYDQLGALVFHLATNRLLDREGIDQESNYLGEADGRHLWLIYRDDICWLKSPEAAFTLSFAREIVENKRPGAHHLVFAAARFVSQRVLTQEKLQVEFAPLPFALYRVG